MTTARHPSTHPSSPAPGAPCPICGRAADARYRPFCTRRCADVDLGRWLGEGYRIPAAPTEDDEAERPPMDPPSVDGVPPGRQV